MTDEDRVHELFEAAAAEPTVAEREAILGAAEPVLAAHRAAAHPGPDRRPAASLVERLRALLVPRGLAFAAAVALIVAVVVFSRGTPVVREPRSAPVRSWAEHESPDPDHTFPLASESFGRPY